MQLEDAMLRTRPTVLADLIGLAQKDKLYFFDPLPPLKVGDMVYYRDKLCLVESVDGDEAHGFCGLIDNDGDTYTPSRRYPDLHNAGLRIAAEMCRDEFDF
jgi:hypothetical protein